jgi:3-hydroxybutyryl-CoA dehydratase
MIVKGTTFKCTYIIDEGIYNGFISLFQDNNPLHTNEIFAQRKGFDSIVMHGNILNGFISHFVGECLPSKDVIIHSQDIKYLKPVYLNDILDLYVDVQDYFESVKAIEFKFYFQNQNKIKVARGNISIGLL